MEEKMNKNKIKLTGNNLKIIAIITMLIDHIGEIFIENNIILYNICRIIGRLSFRIFCFLIVEGFTYTKNIKKYLFYIFYPAHLFILYLIKKI